MNHLLRVSPIIRAIQCLGLAHALQSIRYLPKVNNLANLFNHSHKKRKDSLKTRAEPAVLRTYVENQAILEPTLLYRLSKCKQTKEQGSEDYLWTYIFTFLCDYCQLFFLFLARCK